MCEIPRKTGTCSRYNETNSPYSISYLFYHPYFVSNSHPVYGFKPCVFIRYMHHTFSVGVVLERPLFCIRDDCLLNYLHRKSFPRLQNAAAYEVVYFPLQLFCSPGLLDGLP